MNIVKLGEIIKLEYGKPLDQSDRVEGGSYPAYGANGIKAYTNKYYYDKPSIIVGRKGSAGELNLTSGNFWPLDVTYYVTHDETQTDLKYIFYLLKTLDLTSLARGVKPGINRNDVYGINVPIFTLQEQQKIVAKLDAAFGKINMSIELTKQNTSNSRVLFDKLIDDHILSKQKQDSIPLGSVCNFVRGPFGGSLRKDIFRDSGFAVYEQRHAIYNSFSNVRYFIDESKFNEMKRFEVQPGDLIMSCSGTMGKIAIAPDNLKPGIINQALLKFTPHLEKLDTQYLSYWIESAVFQNMLGINSGGAAIKNVASVKILKELPISLPSLPEQQEIICKISNLKNLQTNLVKSMDTKLVYLNQLKQSMLHDAFSESAVK